MGASISTNVANSLIDTANTVINQYEQTCSLTTGTGTNNEIIVSGCSATGTIFNIVNQQIVNQSCITNATTQTSISKDISQTMQQAAQAITQQFAFGTVSAAQDFLDTTIKLGDRISNIYQSTCIGRLGPTNNKIVCKDSNVSGSVFKIDNFQSVTQSCVLEVATKTNEYQRVVNLLTQTAVAKAESTFFSILIAIGFILLVFAWFIINVAETPAVQWIIVILVLLFAITTVIYTLSALRNGMYPYKKA